MISTVLQIAAQFIYPVMAVIFIWGLVRAYRLSQYSKDFNAVTKRIESGDDAVAEIRGKITGKGEKTAVFNNWVLKEALDEYCEAYQKTLSTKNAAPYVDITNYYNADFLDKIGQTGICDLIPGTMTGLGILGTFLGLVAGISGFDSATAETITSSIKTLLDGMSTAFFTSIAGVICSFVFSYIHKFCYEKASKSLEDYVMAFHAKNLDGSESTAENQLLTYQQQQTELLGNFATVVSAAIAQTMRTELVPIFDEMKDTINAFGTVASRDQKEGLDQVVQEFIRCMNETLHGQFEELSATIQSICEWQKASTEQMKKVVDGICDTSSQIEQINTASRQTVEEMNSFVNLLKAYQEQLHTDAELVQKRLENGDEIAARQANYINQLVESENRVADLAASVKNEAETARQMAELLTAHCQEQISSITDAAQQDMEALSASTKVLVESSHAQIDTLAQAAESELQMLSGTAAQLSDANSSQLEALTSASTEQMKQIADAAQSVMQSSQQQVEASIAATKAQSDQMVQASNEFTAFVQQEHQKLVEAVDREVAGLSGIANETTSGLQSATAGIENAAKLLDQNLDGALERTFTSFDQNLTDISQHLSGTIADVRDTTEALPHVIREAQKQYEKVLGELTQQTQEYLAAMKTLTAQVNQNVQYQNSEEGKRK